MDASAVISELADSLGVAVSDLTNAYAPFLLGRLIACVAASAVVTVIGIITLLVALKIYLDWRKSRPVYDIVPSHIWGMTAIGATLTVIGAAVFLSTLPDLVGAIMSPSGAVVADILSRVSAASV